MKKIIRPEGPAKKITLLRYCPNKIFQPSPRPPLPPPPKFHDDRCKGKAVMRRKPFSVIYAL